jgi:hypothetical protein
MTIPARVRAFVRSRANFACEYCGVTETDVGATLTIDHYHPQAEGGSDDSDNLLYCCPFCNQCKGDYWPSNSLEPSLWNPRQELCEQHFLPMPDGTLHPLTSTGRFTLARLRLNRAPLTAHRRRKQQEEENRRLLERYDAALNLLEVLHTDRERILAEQRELLERQREVIRLLLEGLPPPLNMEP